MCYSKCGSRLSTAHIRFTNLQQFHGSRGCVTQNVALALAPRTFVLTICNSFTDRGGALLKMWLSPQRRAHSFFKAATVSRIEAGSFSKCGSRLSAAHIRFQHLQQFHGSRGCVTRNVALALAPRTFVLQICNSFTDRGHVLLKM